MTVFSKKFLIITAHPDDLEMGCSGLVTKVKLAGGQVTNLILVPDLNNISFELR